MPTKPGQTFAGPREQFYPEEPKPKKPKRTVEQLQTDFPGYAGRIGPSLPPQQPAQPPPTQFEPPDLGEDRIGYIDALEQASGGGLGTDYIWALSNLKEPKARLRKAAWMLTEDTNPDYSVLRLPNNQTAFKKVGETVYKSLQDGRLYNAAYLSRMLGDKGESQLWRQILKGDKKVDPLKVAYSYRLWKENIDMNHYSPSEVMGLAYMSGDMTERQYGLLVNNYKLLRSHERAHEADKRDRFWAIVGAVESAKANIKATPEWVLQYSESTVHTKDPAERVKRAETLAGLLQTGNNINRDRQIFNNFRSMLSRNPEMTVGEAARISGFAEMPSYFTNSAVKWGLGALPASQLAGGAVGWANKTFGKNFLEKENEVSRILRGETRLIYKDIVKNVIDEAKVDRAVWEKTPIYRFAFGPTGRLFNAIERRTQGYFYKGLKWTIRGTEELTGQFNEKEWEDRNEDEADLFAGRSTLGSLAKEGGAPDWAATGIDIATLWAADPFWWGTGAMKAMKSARSIQNVMRSRTGMASLAKGLAESGTFKNFTAAQRTLERMGLTNDPLKWAKWVDETITSPIPKRRVRTRALVRKLIGEPAGDLGIHKIVARVLYRSDDFPAESDWMRHLFHTMTDRVGVKSLLWEDMRKLVLFAKKQGAPIDEVEDTVHDILRGAFGIRPPKGSVAERFTTWLKFQEDFTPTGGSPTRIGAKETLEETWGYDPQIIRRVGELPYAYRWARRYGDNVGDPDGLDYAIAAENNELGIWRLEQQEGAVANFNELDELWANLMDTDTMRVGMSHSVPYFGGPLRTMRTNLDRFMSGKNLAGVAGGWRTITNMRPSMIANIEDKFDEWVVTVLRRGDLHTSKEIAIFKQQAIDVARKYRGTNRTDDFIALMHQIRDDMWSKTAKKRGLPEELLQPLRDHHNKEFGKQLLRVFGHENQQLIDAVELGTSSAISKAIRDIGTPIDAPQLLNEWSMMDPLSVDQIVKDAVGLSRTLGNAFRNATGKEVKWATELHNPKIRKAVRGLLSRSTDSYLRVVKPLLVVSPRYIFRVPMGDEQLRILITHGIWARMLATRAAGKLARSKIGGVREPGKTIHTASALDERNLNEALREVGFENAEDAVNQYMRLRENKLTPNEVSELEVRLGLIDERYKGMVETTAREGWGESDLFNRHLAAADAKGARLGVTHHAEEDLHEFLQGHYASDTVDVDINLDYHDGGKNLDDLARVLVYEDPNVASDLITSVENANAANPAQDTIYHELFHVLAARGKTGPEELRFQFEAIMQEIDNAFWTKPVRFESIGEDAAEAYALWKIDPANFSRLFPEYGNVFKKHKQWFAIAHKEASKHTRITTSRKGRGFKIEVEDLRASDMANDAMAGIGSPIDQWYETLAAETRRTVKAAFEETDQFGRKSYDTLSPAHYDGAENVDHMNAWHYDLIHQMAPGPLAKVAFQGIADGYSDQRIVNKILDKMKTAPGASVAEDLGVNLDDFDSMVARAWEVLRASKHITGAETAPQFASTIASRAIDADQRGLMEILRQVPIDQRPKVSAWVAARESGNRNPVSIAIRAANRYILQSMSNYLARFPMARMEMANMFNALKAVAKEQGVPLDRQMILNMKQEARVFAQDRVKKILFDFSTQSRFGELTRFIFPFFQPFAETFTVYGHLIRENPRLLAWAKEMAMVGRETGFIREEDGELVIPVTWWGGAGAIANMLWGNPQGLPGWTLFTGLENMSFWLASTLDVPLPGGSQMSVPWPSSSAPITWALQKVVDNLPDGEPGSYLGRLKQSVWNYAYQYGEVDNMFEASIPAYLRTTLTSFGWMNDSQVKSANTLMQRQMEAMGITPESIAKQEGLPVDKAKRLFVKRAGNMARGLLWMKAINQLFFFASPTYKPPTDVLTDELHRLQGKLGPIEGEDEFLKRHPNNPSIAIATTFWSSETTNSEVSLPPNKIREAILNAPEFREHVEDNPRFAFLLMADEVWEADMDKEVFFKDLDEGWRLTKNPYDFVDDREILMGWEAWRAVDERWEIKKRQLELAGFTDGDPTWTDAYRDLYQKPVEQIRRENKRWAVEFDVNDKLGLNNRLESDLREISTHPVLGQTQGGMFLSEYFEMRDPIRDEMRRNNTSSLKYDETLRAEFNQAKDALIERYGPSAQRVYSYFLKNDLNKVDTIRDEQNDNITPEQEVIRDDWTLDRTELANAVNTSRGVEQRGYYHQMRQHMDAAYDYKDVNPAALWWEQQTRSEKESYQRSLLARPAVFWSRFDRETVLGMTTSDRAEEYWLQYSNARFEIDKWREDHPEDSPRDLYQALDQQVIKWVNKDANFRAQVVAANSWGHPFLTHGIPGETDSVIEQGGSAGRAWRALLISINNMNRTAIDREMTGESDYDDLRAATFEASKQWLENWIKTELFDYSETFKRQFNELDIDYAGDSLIDALVPTDYFPIGGFQMAKQTIKPLKIKTP